MESSTKYWLMEQIRQKLKDVCNEQGMTQSEVGEEMGKDAVFVRNCESGRRRIDPVELLMFADVYDMDIEELYDLDRDEARNRDYMPNP